MGYITVNIDINDIISELGSFTENERKRLYDELDDEFYGYSDDNYYSHKKMVSDNLQDDLLLDSLKTLSELYTLNEIDELIKIKNKK